MPFHFTLQDILSMLLAILLFPLVWVFPGHVIGWLFDVFTFRQRTKLAQFLLSIALSNAVIPAILFLAFRFVSNSFGISIISIFFVLWVVIQIRQVTGGQVAPKLAWDHKMALATGSLWIAFFIFLLVDLQIGQKLYFNAASFDFTTRTALIEAITRTGVPPINPSYYPGHFERITELYYFWYIPGSVVDTLGGKWVDARISLFAGIVWTGLCLIATIATYLRIRNPDVGKSAWGASALGTQLLAISGLDFVPVMAIMIAVKTSVGRLPFDGRIEGWNLPIMSWLNALTWVPNHVASLAACMIAMLALLSSNRTTGFRWVVHVALAGVSIGSAFGLSTWVTLTFGVFMTVWSISLLFQKIDRSTLVAIMAAGVLGLIVASPFLMDILGAGGKSEVTGKLPIGLYVRHFAFSGTLEPGIREVIGVLLLPLNYFFELGFFFLVAVLWIRQRRTSKDWQSNPFWQAELLLLATVVVLLSFVKSTVIVINDLGMRGWLLGQFILLVWAIDLLNTSSNKHFALTPALIQSIPQSKRIKDLLSILLIVGLLTTGLEASSTRFWTILVDKGVTGVPNELTPDMNLGERTFDGRLAYEFIRDHTPKELFIQNNPTHVLDRPSGLYGTRQMIIADRTAYGVPADVFKQISASVGEIFLAEDITDWTPIDRLCNQYSIQAIIVDDTDPLWSSLKVLRIKRAPIYANRYYAVFRCGNRD